MRSRWEGVDSPALPARLLPFHQPQRVVRMVAINKHISFFSQQSSNDSASVGISALRLMQADLGAGGPIQLWLRALVTEGAPGAGMEAMIMHRRGERKH